MDQQSKQKTEMNLQLEILKIPAGRFDALKKRELTIAERLGIARAPDWKLLVRDFEQLEELNPETMQQVLDYVSPTKSPIREGLEDDVVGDE